MAKNHYLRRLFVSMKIIYKIIRALLVSVLVVILVAPLLLYVAISLPPVQEKMCTIAERELSKLLGTVVEIGSINFTPFNHVALNDVTIKDAYSEKAATIETIGAGIDLYEFFKNDNIVITHAELIKLDATIYKKDPSSPLNIHNIINALQPKDKTKPPTMFDLRINTVVIRESQASYDILSAPEFKNQFDKNHIKITDLNADILLPQVKNDDFIVNIKRLNVKEQSGINLKKLQGNFHIASTGISIENFELFVGDSKFFLADMAIKHDNWKDLGEKMKVIPLNIELKKGSYITLHDLGPFIPGFKNMNERFNLDISLRGELNDLLINRLNISHNSKPLNIEATGALTGIKEPKSVQIALSKFLLTANANEINSILSAANIAKPEVREKIAQLGNISIDGRFNGQPLNAVFEGLINTALGNADINLDYNIANNSTIALKGNLKTSGIEIGKITANDKLGSVAGDIAFNVDLSPGNKRGSLDGTINHFDFNNYRYNNISASVSLDNSFIKGEADINDPNITLAISGEADINKNDSYINVHADAQTINFDKINIMSKPCYLSAKIDADIKGGLDIDNTIGSVNISELHFSDKPGKELYIDNIAINAQNDSTGQSIDINSRFLNASLNGSFSYKTIVPAVKDILSHSFPVFFGENSHNSASAITTQYRPNNFAFNISLEKDENVFDYFGINTELFVPISFSGNVDHPQHRMNMEGNIPYLVAGNKLIEKTQIELDIDQSIDKCFLRIFSMLPMRNDNVPVEILCNASENQVDASLSWVLDRKTTFRGDLFLSTLFSRDENNQLVTDLYINPSNLVFNDSVWTIQQAKIHYADKNIEVKNFDVRHGDQFITLTGKASQSPNDVLRLDLKNVNLDYIFQTLEINKALIGGDATGTFYASQVFSKSPIAHTPELKVKNISYNGTVLGDASIKAHWNNAQKAVSLDALISQEDGNKSRIYGEIFPMTEALDINFEANRIKVGFMQPYMSAFASDIEGFASGKARLYGSFKYIDMTGDIYAEDLRMKINFTNTYYSATDSIILRPSEILLNDITLKDPNGNTAKLNGFVKHEYFKNPKFDFSITEAKNFLCYDVKPQIGEIWHGHINGNGFAHINGEPGVVNILVEMETAPQSSFTFILSDMQNAYDYKFLTFRDKEALKEVGIEIPVVDNEPPAVKKFRKQQKKKEEDIPSIYNMRINVNVTPQAQMILVMDPIGGDQIKARGSGLIKMSYQSGSEELKMYGNYEIDEGTYNFTLQDIIIKDFKIRDNSSIAFNGDPFAAKLDITAAYNVKANLSDLDESFLEDKDLNRTNVPVNALLYIKDDMTQPNISFDLEFPTLKQDAYSKVKSIISTDEMMKRQILYLMALNRFYTPEYMTTTKGNEIFSVASSTLSSQLSSMLGQLSDNWSFSPLLRSDLGDFSDVEVDLALSSTLLNNRLRFNGNFGYRDKSLNTNQFIGDFDIEYLLNPRGSWRLRAYNRYNDQNYYLKTATTTQGVGIMYRQDFDNFLNFINVFNWGKNDNNDTEDNKKEQVDSTANVYNADSILIIK